MERKGRILYATKYGSTGLYARALSRRLGWPAVRVTDGEAEPLAAGPPVILGGPIYGPSVLPVLAAWIERNREALSGSPVAAFVVCGDTLWNPRAGEGGAGNLRKLTDLLPAPPVAAAVFGGRLRMEDLDGEDGPRIRAFYRRLGREPTGFDRMDLSAVEPFAADLRKALRAGGRRR